MSASQFEQLDRFEDQDESRNMAQRQEAIDCIRQYQNLATRSDAGCYIFGLIYFNADDLRHALTWFDRALALRPSFPEARSARAIVLQRLGQPKDALESFHAILKLWPHDAETLFNKGVVLQSLGRMAEALAAYEDALRCCPAHCEA